MQFIDFSKKNNISPFECLDGREWSTLSDEELQQLKELHGNGQKDGFYLTIEPYDNSPELQMEIYNAPTREKQFEILRRLQVKVCIIRTSNLTHLAGSK